MRRTEAGWDDEADVADGGFSLDVCVFALWPFSGFIFFCSVFISFKCTFLISTHPHALTHAALLTP